MQNDASRPNFLFITTDQQRWDALGVNNPRIRTPAMDAIAHGGMQMNRMYPTNAICMPARASMITGRSQRGHQVFNHDVCLSEAIPVLGDSLNRAGYQTALIGKAHFKTAHIEDALADNPPPGAGVNPADGLWYGPYFGFQHVELQTSHAYDAGHYRVWLERNHPEGLELWKRANALAPRSGAYMSWKNAIPAEWHYTHWTADRTIAWLRRYEGDQPFFLWMSFSDPHAPFAPPQPYGAMYDDVEFPPPVPREDVSGKPPVYRWARDGKPYQGYRTQEGWSGEHYQEIVRHYYGLTTFIDDSIARVLGELDKMGLTKDTHIVFTSDHGEGLADHGVAAKPMMSYECTNRVPMLWQHPTVRSGSVYAGVMTQLDLTPTFLELAGAEPLPGMEGRSFAGVLRGDVDAHRNAVIVERITVLPKQNDGEYAAPQDAVDRSVVRVKMLVTEKWKLLHYGGAPYGELYDVVNDPEDIHNLWDDPAFGAVRRELTDRLLAELIDSELGDVARILRRQAVSGALRDHALMEPQPMVRADLSERTRGLQEPSRGS